MATPPLGSKKQVTSTDTSVTPPVVKKGHIGTHIIQWFKDTFNALSKKMKGAWESVKSYFSKPKPQSLKNHTAVGLQPDKENPPITNTPIVARRPSGMATPSQTPAMQPGRSQQPKGPSRVVLLDEAVGADGNLRTFAREENVFVRKPREQNQPIVTPTAASPSAAHVGVIAPKEPLQPAVRVPRLKNINTQKLNDAVVPEDIVKLANAKKESSGVPILYTENQKVIYNGPHSEGRNVYATISYIAPEGSEGHGQCALKIENIKGIMPALLHELTPIPEDLASAPQTPAPSLGAGAAPAPSPAAATVPQGFLTNEEIAKNKTPDDVVSLAQTEKEELEKQGKLRYEIGQKVIYKGTHSQEKGVYAEILAIGKNPLLKVGIKGVFVQFDEILPLPKKSKEAEPIVIIPAQPAAVSPGVEPINPMKAQLNIKKNKLVRVSVEHGKSEPVVSEQPSSKLEADLSKFKEGVVNTKELTSQEQVLLEKPSTYKFKEDEPIGDAFIRKTSRGTYEVFRLTKVTRKQDGSMQINGVFEKGNTIFPIEAIKPEDLYPISSFPSLLKKSTGSDASKVRTADAVSPEMPEPPTNEDPRLGNVVNDNDVRRMHSREIAPDSFDAGEMVLVFQNPNYRYGMVVNKPVPRREGGPLTGNTGVTINFGDKDEHGQPKTVQTTVAFIKKILPWSAYKSDLSPSVGVAAASAQPAAPSPGAEQINPMRARVNIQKHKPSKPDERPVEASVAAGAGAKAAKAGRGYVRPVLGSIVAMANELGNEIRGIIVGVIEEDDLFYINFPPSKDNIPCKLIDKYQNILVTLDGKESFVKVIEVKKSEKEKGGLRFKNNI